MELKIKRKMEDYDFITIEGKRQTLNFYVKKQNREYYKARGFTTQGIVYFLENFNNLGGLDLFPMRTSLRDDGFVIDGKYYPGELTLYDIELAMGKRKVC